MIYFILLRTDKQCLRVFKPGKLNIASHGEKMRKIEIILVMFLYQMPVNIHKLSDYISKLASRRYHLYLKEEKRHLEWVQYIIRIILWLVKLLTNGLENVNIKKKRIVEKISVE